MGMARSLISGRPPVSGTNAVFSELQPLLRSADTDENSKPRRPTSIFDRDSQRRDNSRYITTILMINYMIGSGILNQAQVFSLSGVAAASCLYVVAALAIWLGLVVLIEAVGRCSSAGGVGVPDELGFSELAMVTMGEKGSKAIDASIILMNFGDCCSYVLVVGSLLTSLLDDWTGGTGGAWTSFYLVTSAVVIFLVLPLCLIRHFSNLSVIATFSLGAIMSVVLLVVIGGPIYSRSEGIFEEDSGVDTTILWWNWTEAAVKMGSVVFALTAAPAAFHSYTSMYPPSERVWRGLTAVAVAVGCTACYVTGLVGYLSFRSSTAAEILDNFGGFLGTLFKIIVIVHLIVYIPYEIVILRHSLFALLGHDVMKAGVFSVLAVTSAVLGGILFLILGLVAIGVAEGELFGYILDLTGGITASLTSFVLPAIIYIKASETRGPHHFKCLALAAFGVGVMIMVPVSLVLSFLGYS